MTRYFIPRFIFIFQIELFYGIIRNLVAQINNFFRFYEFDSWFFFNGLILVLVLLWFYLTYICLNIPFTLIRLSEEKGLDKALMSINKHNFKLYLKNYGSILCKNSDYEFEKESQARFIVFITLAIFYIGVINGSPLFKNYIGIYKDTAPDELFSSDNQKKYNILQIDNTEELTRYLNSVKSGQEDLEENVDKNFKIKKRGYIFLQTGRIEGFFAPGKYDDGLLAYIECIIVYALEKLITAFIYFGIPFLLILGFLRIEEFKDNK